MLPIGQADPAGHRRGMGASGRSMRSAWERLELVESGLSALEATPRETDHRTGIPDASVFCIAGALGFLRFSR